MKKSIIFILILSSIFTLGKFILDNKEDNPKKHNISTKENTSLEDNKKENISNKDLQKSNTNKENKSDKIVVDNEGNEYLVAIDSTVKEVVISENLSDSNKYIKLDYEKIIPIVKDIENPKHLSIFDYINLYSEVSPHIDTNMSYSELLSIASNININDFKSSYYDLIDVKND